MKLLVVGCGSIGWRHLGNLREMDAAEISVCDADPTVADRAGAHFGVAVHRRLEDGLDSAPHAVLVCAPTHLHLEVARMAVAAGAHVFIEKPLAVSLEEVPLLVESLAARRVTALVGCNMRFHPGVSHLKGLVDSGELGEPLLVRAWFGHYLPNWRPTSDYRSGYGAVAAQGGGMILEGVHEIDYVRWLAGEVRAIDAHGGHVSALETDAEDTALLALSFSGGAIGEIHLDCLRPMKSRGCEIVGSEGAARWASEGKNPEVVRVETWNRTGTVSRVVYSSDAYDSNQMYIAEMRHFLECVTGVQEPLLDVPNAARVLALALEARASLATHAA